MGIYTKLLNEGMFLNQKMEKRRKLLIKKINNAIRLINKVKDREKEGFFFDDYEICSFCLFYDNITQKQFESRIKETQNKVKDIMKFFTYEYEDKDEDDEELFNYFNKYRNDEWYEFRLLSSGLFLYNLSKHQFFYGECNAKYITCKSFEDFKNCCKEFYKKEWKDIEKADQYLGYYRITKAPEKGTK